MKPICILVFFALAFTAQAQSGGYFIAPSTACEGVRVALEQIEAPKPPQGWYECGRGVLWRNSEYSSYNWAHGVGDFPVSVGYNAALVWTTFTDGYDTKAYTSNEVYVYGIACSVSALEAVSEPPDTLIALYTLLGAAVTGEAEKGTIYIAVYENSNKKRFSKIVAF
jgi:hypothetical protein